MHLLDWAILLGTLGFIVGYGVWKTRHTRTSEGYLRGGDDARWWGVGLSVMATQASAITFLSTPGQGFTDGLAFVQFYFGLPLAMVVINLVFIPLYYKWKVFTAYEFIGKRFDRRTRLLTAGLFLVQRSMAAGITIYAPSIILSKVLGWPLSWTCLFIGVLVIVYTTTGGARAVGVTHKQQMAVMFAGLFVAFALVVHYLAPVMSFPESLRLAGTLGKLHAVDLSFDPADKYTLWSGLIGGSFLQLSYFGTDQSQVQRYLGGQTMQQAKMGLWMNALLKIPMQFFILLTGVLVFVFYLVHAAPLHWNATNVAALEQGPGAAELHQLEARHNTNNNLLASLTQDWLQAGRTHNPEAQAEARQQLGTALVQDKALRAQAGDLLHVHHPEREANDKDYIFITFIMDHLPIGVIGLLLAMIFSAGMSSTSAELSALATTAVVDVLPPKPNDTRLVRRSQWATVGFGLLALAFAAVFSLFENLIQAVNILGSLFYGTILGIFLVAFFLKQVQGTAVFMAAIIAQAAIFILHFSGLEVAFLWYNLIAPAITVVLALIMQPLVAASERGGPR